MSREPIPWGARLSAQDMEVLLRSRLSTPLRIEDVRWYFGTNNVAEQDGRLYAYVPVPLGCWLAWLGTPKTWHITVDADAAGAVTHIDMRFGGK